MGTERVLGKGCGCAGADHERNLATAGKQDDMADHVKRTHRIGLAHGAAGLDALRGSGHEGHMRMAMDGMNMDEARYLNVPAKSKFMASMLSLLLLSAGVLIAAKFGSFSIHKRDGQSVHEVPLRTVPTER